MKEILSSGIIESIVSVERPKKRLSYLRLLDLERRNQKFLVYLSLKMQIKQVLEMLNNVTSF